MNKSPWISVKDRVPEVEDADVDYLVHESDGSINTFHYNAHLWKIWEITYWMVIPPAPGE